MSEARETIYQERMAATQRDCAELKRWARHLAQRGENVEGAEAIGWIIARIEARCEPIPDAESVHRNGVIIDIGCEWRPADVEPEAVTA